MITVEEYLPLFIAVSLIPTIFQGFVLYYLIRVRQFIGNKSFWLMTAMSGLGLVYDIIITTFLIARVNIGEPITLLNVFFGFIFPSARAGLLLWLTYIMARGLTYHGSKKTKKQQH